MIREALSLFGQEIDEQVQLLAFAPAATHPYNLAWSESVRATLEGISNVTVEVNLRDLANPEKIACFRAADVVLVPFAGPVAVEPPLTLVEAMACGAVPFVSPQANRSGLVEDGHNGVEFSSAGELALNLERVFRDSKVDSNAALGERARESAVRAHGFAAASRAVSDLWSALAESRTA
jgi:glycosyltransferase involved in cell wall biosynthesis